MRTQTAQTCLACRSGAPDWMCTCDIEDESEEKFQRDRSEWFSAPICEIIREYEDWRASQLAGVVGELEETYAAFRWVFENGLVPAPLRPQWVSDVFNNAYASQRIARVALNHGASL